MKTHLIIIILAFSMHSFAQDTIEVKCDSIYQNKEIIIKFFKFNDEEDGYFGEKNSVLIIEQKGKTIIKDSIFSKIQEVTFEDYNNDNFKDILIQNTSDVRSNWTYYLYLYNPKTSTFKKVKWFEQIKNPKNNLKDNIVESYVVSGQNWVGFYIIKENKAIDLNIEIIDDQSESFEKNYQKAIKKIKAKK